MASVFNRKKVVAALLWASMVYLMTGCAANYARFQIDDQTEQAFKKYEMIDGFQYYYSGRENTPSAIVGIDPAFEFTSTLWTAIEPSLFKTMVDRMYPPGYGRLYGANIVAPDGRKAGVWYSWVPFHSAKVDGGKILVHSPELLSEPDGLGSFKSP